MKGFNIAEQGHVVNALAPIDIGGGAQTSDYWNMKNYAHASIIITMGVVGNDTLIKLYEAKDSAGATKEFKTFWTYKELTANGDTLATGVLTAVGGFQTGTNNATTFVLEVDASELTDTYPYMAILTDAAAAALISVVVILSGSRHQGDPSKESPTAIT